jgi:lipopolysaccharide export system protein LptA
MTKVMHMGCKGLLWILLCWGGSVAAQDSTGVPTADSSEIIHLINADELMGIQPGGKDSAQLQKLTGHVKLIQGQTIFSCDSALQNLTNNTIDAYGHIHINQADTINTFSDYLHYEGDTKIATLRNNVRMTDGTMVLTTNTLVYDMNTHIGSYLDGGRLVNQSTVLTSERGYYYADTKDVYFKSAVQLQDPEYTLATDTLLYNTNSRIATFVAPTTINTGKSIIHTQCGYYNTIENYAHLCDRSTIIDSAQWITADSMNYTKTTGIGEAFGNVNWTDTARKMTILAGYAVSHQNENTILATRQPLLIIAREKDTLYMASDTLYSAPLPPSATPGDSTVQAATIASEDDSSATLPADTLAGAGSDTTSRRYVIAYHHVRLFSDSLQGASDSLYYSDRDSAFHFYTSPVLWTGQTQLTGDTIVLFTRNQQADRILLDQHAMIINQIAPTTYNQIKGTQITGYFKTGNELDWMSVRGNAESMYYAQDDSGALVGGNHATSANIHLYFQEGKLDKVVFLKDVDGDFMQPTKVPEENRQLRGFRWEDDRRPRSEAELMQ